MEKECSWLAPAAMQGLFPFPRQILAGGALPFLLLAADDI